MTDSAVTMCDGVQRLNGARVFHMRHVNSEIQGNEKGTLNSLYTNS